MFLSRQRRKGQQGIVAGAAESSFSPYGRRRRRSDTDGSTLLPTTYHPSSAFANNGGFLRRNNTPPPTTTTTPMPTCNSFLLGGHYYPGKDKKRRHLLRRKTLWYRIMCSSTWRSVLSALLVTVLLVWWIVLPTVDLLLEYGKLLSPQLHRRYPSSSSQTWDTIPSFPIESQLPPMEDQITSTEHLQKLRRQERNNQRQERLKLLERIVPDWFHRNDNDSSKHDNNNNSKVAKTKTKTITKDRRTTAPKQTPTTKQEEPSMATGETPVPRGEHVKGESTEHTKPQTADGVNHPDRKEPQGVILDHDKAPKKRYEEKETIQPVPETNTQPPNDGGSAAVSDAANNQLLPQRDESGSTTTTAKRRIQRTLLNADTTPSTSSCPASLSSFQINTTLVVQCSLDRMFVLNETCARWKDPIVATVHVPTPTDMETLLGPWRVSCPQMTILPFYLSQEEWKYPVNEMRNVALDAVQTSHLLVTDVDFVPSRRLDQQIQLVLHNRVRQRNAQTKRGRNTIAPENRDAIVVPAFERRGNCTTHQKDDNDDAGCGHYRIRTNSSFLPQTLNDLKACVGSRDCGVFQGRNNWEGHYSTQSGEWLLGDWYQDDQEIRLDDGTFQHPIKELDCFHSLRYEPYVVIRWCPSLLSSSSLSSSPKNNNNKTDPVAPYYDERFYGYGKNKIEMISHLRFLGYRFSILPEGFIVHNPHAESKAKQAWNNVHDYKLHENMDELYPVFLRELWNKYRNVTEHVVQPCQQQQQQQQQRQKEQQEQQDDGHTGRTHNSNEDMKLKGDSG